MKTLLLIVVFSLGHLFINAQQINFIKYWGDGLDDCGYDVRQLKDSGYMVVGLFEDSSAYPNGGLIMRTDKYGNLLKLKIVCGVTGPVYKTTDSSIFVFGGYFSACGTNGVFLYEVNYNLDTIWHKDFNYGFSSYCDVGNNEHYTIGGGYVSKLDSNWNLETYWDYTNINPALNLIKTTPDGGFVAAGLNYTQPDSLQTYTVLKCDSNGVQQWYRTYGTNPPDYINLTQYPPTSILVLPDSNYIITTIGNWDLFKINKDSGDTVFTRKYSMANNMLGVPSITSISNNRYIATTENGISFLDTTFNIIATGMMMGLNSPWYQANDGGFYGAKYVNQSIFPILQHYAVALIKTDSLGFIYNYQGIAQLQQVGGLSVYPNPVLNELTISNVQLANKAVTVIVYDVIGKQKLQQNLTAIDGKLKMNVSSLVSGIYFSRVDDNGKVYNGKFIKL